MPPPHCLPPALRRPPDCPHHPGAQAANPTTCLRLSFSNPGGSTYSKHGFHFYRQASPGNSSAHNQRPCLSSMKPNSPTPPIPQATGSRTPLSLTSSDFGPKQPKPEGPHPEIELIKPAAAPPTVPSPSWQHREAPPPWAAQVLSLVSIFRPTLVLRKRGATNRKPSLELLRHRPWAHSHRLHMC